MHHPMTRRTVGEIKVLEAWRFSKKLVPVGRHFIQSCHTICPVNSKRRKLWHTLFRTCHDFFDPPLLECRIEWISCPIIHWQQQEYSSVASAKVKTVLRENRHRHILRQKICGIRDRNLPLCRCNRKNDACHASNDRSPCSGGIDNPADAVRLLRSSNVGNAGRSPSLFHGETRTLSSKLKLSAQLLRSLHISFENIHRFDEAVDGTKRSADNSIKADRRIMLSDVVRRNFPHISQARLLLNLFRRSKDGQLMLILRDKEVAARPIARVDAKFIFEMKKFLSREKRELYADFRSELAAKSARGFRCTSGSGLFARIDDEDIRFTSDGKVIRNACTNDTTANDEMIDGSHSLSDPGSSPGGNDFEKDGRDA